MRSIGLIAAMAQESRALLRCLQGWERLGPGPVYRLEIGARTCFLATSGMGVRRAREAARRLAATYSVEALVSFGIAGAVEADLEIGDVVAAEGFCRLEGGVLSPLQPLAVWPEAARDAMAQALSARGARLFDGTAVTTGGSQFVQPGAGKLPRPVLEMETAGIAQVAAENGVPLFSLRAISDGPRAPIPLDLGKVMDEDANLRLGGLLVELLRRPAALFEAGQMRRNSCRAEEMAALALVAGLSASHPGEPT